MHIHLNPVRGRRTGGAGIRINPSLQWTRQAVWQSCLGHCSTLLIADVCVNVSGPFTISFLFCLPPCMTCSAPVCMRMGCRATGNWQIAQTVRLCTKSSTHESHYFLNSIACTGDMSIWYQFVWSLSNIQPPACALTLVIHARHQSGGELQLNLTLNAKPNDAAVYP